MHSAGGLSVTSPSTTCLSCVRPSRGPYLTPPPLGLAQGCAFLRRGFGATAPFYARQEATTSAHGAIPPTSPGQPCWMLAKRNSCGMSGKKAMSLSRLWRAPAPGALPASASVCAVLLVLVPGAGCRQGWRLVRVVGRWVRVGPPHACVLPASASVCAVLLVLVPGTGLRQGGCLVWVGGGQEAGAGGRKRTPTHPPTHTHTHTQDS